MKLFRSLPVFALTFFSALSAAAQTANARARYATVGEQNLVTLRGNTHPLARPEYDHGAAPDNLPMERMLLVLQRRGAGSRPAEIAG